MSKSPDASAADNDKTRFRLPPAGSGAATGSGWGDPALWADAGPIPGVGSIINERFVLEESIGAGGMGTVFKARDLRKVEAQDRNPYVAIKILNEEFRRHPQALQALQRESRKTQKLAHPNIVTVYDFDRDGANVYMVMELLEGEPLDRLIRRNAGLGLGVKEALRLTEGICRAMAHAHEQGIVHADFKPANAFLTRDNVIKVLDFGIARAVQHSEQLCGEMTVFDPGTLGALTPAYAGCEVIAGAEPDVRDDIYAIACVAYELVSGRHPFDRLSAVQARDAGLNPESPRGIAKRQWRTLKRGLFFSREQRPKSVVDFFDDLRPLRRLPAVYAAAGGAAIGLVAVLIMLTSGWVERYQQHSLARALASGEATRIGPLLPQLQQLDPGRRASLLLEERARTGLAKYFESRVDVLVDSSNGHYDYTGAAAVLDELEQFLPDSQVVQDIRGRLNARKSAEVARENNAFDFDLQHGWLLPQQHQGNLWSLLEIVRQADPQSALPHDARLADAFADQAGKALQRNERALAGELVKAGLVLAPGSPALVALRDQLTSTAVTAADSGSSTGQVSAAPAQQSPAQSSPDELRAQVQAGLGQATLSLPDARVLAADVEELARQRVPDAMSLELQLRTRLAESAAETQASQGLGAALEYTEGAYALFPESKSLRNTLVKLRLADTQRLAKQRDAQIDVNHKKIDGLLASERIDHAWGVAFDRELQRLIALVTQNDPYVLQAKERATGIYVDQAAALRDAQRLTDAGHMLELSRKYAAESAARNREEKLLAAALANQAEENKRREQVERVSSLQRQLLDLAQANDVDAAAARLDEIRVEVPANDSFISRDGPAAVAAAFLRLATSAAQEGQFPLALDFVSRGRAVAPFLKQLNATRTRYSHYQALDRYLTSRARVDAREVRGELAGYFKQDPQEAIAAAQGLLHNLLARINSTPDPQLAMRLSQAAHDIFGKQSVVSVPAQSVAPDSK